MVQVKKRDLPTGATQQEINQAQSLILRGKTGAAFGDPKLQRVIAFLQSRGLQEAQKTFDQRREAVERQEAVVQQEQRETAEGEIFLDGEGFSVAPDIQGQFVVQRRTTSKIPIQETPSRTVIPGGLIESVQQDIREKDLPPVPFVQDIESGIISGLTSDIPIPLIGVDPSTGLPRRGRTTLGSIKTGLESGAGGFTGEVISFFIPTTGIGIGATFGAVKAVKTIPPAVLIGSELLFAPTGIKTALDPTQDPVIRTRSGLLTGLGLLGAGFEVAPFAKGGLATIGTGFRKVSVDEVVDASKLFPSGKGRVIKDIAVAGDDAFDIKLIEKGKGFGFSQAEQEAFIGKRATITTSARGLFGKTDDAIDITGGEGNLGLFFSPTLDAGAGEARVSRLGLKGSLFEFRPDAEFGFVRQKPQIVFARDVPITKAGKPGTARGLGFPSGELEVTLLPGQTLRGKKAGETVIDLQKVELFEALIDVKPTSGGLIPPPKIDIPGFRPSRATTDIVSPFTGAAGAVRTRDIFGKTTTTLTRTPTTNFIIPSFDFAPSPPPRRRRTPSPPIIDTGFFRQPSPPTTIISPPPTRPTTPDRIFDIVDIPGRPPRPPARRPSPPRRPPTDPFAFNIDLGFKQQQKDIRIKRGFKRTPSLGSVIKFQLDIPQIKLGKAFEQSGLFERKFLGSQLIEPLGPFKTKRKKRKKKKK